MARRPLERTYLRNRVRHEAIPALLSALAGNRATPPPSPAAARAALARRVSRAAIEARGAADWIERWARRVLPGHCRIQAGVIALDSRGVASYPFVARRMLLRRLWATAAPGSGGLTHRHLESLSRLVDGARGGARVELPQGWVAVRGPGGWVRLVQAPGRAVGPRARGRAVAARSGGALSGRKGILTTSFPSHGGR